MVEHAALAHEQLGQLSQSLLGEPLSVPVDLVVAQAHAEGVHLVGGQLLPGPLIDEGQLLFLHQLGKGGVGHVDLATHFQIFRRVFQLFWDVRDGGKVRGHVLAHHAVAPGGAAHKAPVLVFQAHREAVDLDLHHIQRFEAFAPHPAVELPQLIKAESVLQAFHLDLMSHLGKPPGRRSAHLLGG